MVTNSGLVLDTVESTSQAGLMEVLFLAIAATASRNSYYKNCLLAADSFLLEAINAAVGL